MSEINCKNCDKIEGDTRKKVRARRAAADVARCALFVALMVVSAFISIPVQPVPFTFQTVVAVLAGLLLGPKRGGAAVAIYVFMGLLGLPVFTKGGGFAYVYQLTFGYVVGFAAAAFAAGLARGKGKLMLPRAVAGSFVGFLVNYAIGIPYFALIWKYYMHLGGLWKALVSYNFLYMPKDIVLCVLASVIAVKVAAALKKEGIQLGGEKSFRQ